MNVQKETTTSTVMEGKRLKTDTEDEASIVDSTGESNSANDAIHEVEGHDGEDNDPGLGMPFLGQLHPLQNPVILAHLFERCSPKLLAQCRLVSKQWYDLSLTSWRATAQLTLYDDPTFEKYLKFVDDPQNRCDTKPRRRIRLVRWKHDLTKPKVQEFWDKFGSNLTSLKFFTGEFPRLDDLRNIIFGSCPNLQRLYLHSCRYSESAPKGDPRELKYVKPTFGEQTNLRLFSFDVLSKQELYQFDMSDHRLPVPWLELLSHFPFLTSLKLSIRSLEGCDMVNEEILKAIELIRQNNKRKLQLRNFDLEPPFKISTTEGYHPAILSRLQELKLPLQSLEVEVDLTQRLTEMIVEGILQRHQNTLSRLSITRKSIERQEGRKFGGDPVTWRFPYNVTLEKLEELRIEMLPKSLSFVNDAPNLRKLEIVQAPGYIHYKEKETRIMTERFVMWLPLMRLTHLKEFKLGYRVTKDDITNLAQLMPNVTKLTMSLNDKLFSTVCQVWGNLKELEVLGDFDLTDLGVTGIEANKAPNEAQGEGGNEASPVRANITNLQDLHSFRFWSHRLTNRSVYDGFLKLPNLKELEVCTEGLIPFGADELILLRDNGIDYLGAYDPDAF